MSSKNNWHPADKQPCVTCSRWMHIDTPIHFLGSRYECHTCYIKRTTTIKQNSRPITPAKPRINEKGRFCSECGQPDYTYMHEIKTWTYELIPVTMYFTADRKLICQRCVTDVRLRHWWKNEMDKPREQHPTYYTSHNPLSVCTCDFCNDPNRPKTSGKTNRHFSNRKRTPQ